MKKSDDGYFKDFFQVLQDKPKVLALEAAPPNYNSSQLIEYPRQSTDVGKSFMKSDQRILMNNQQELVRYDSTRGETTKGDKSGLVEL